MKAEKETILHELENGRCVDYPAYMKLVGKIDGLKRVELYMTEIEQKMQVMSDLDDL